MVTLKVTSRSKGIKSFTARNVNTVKDLRQHAFRSTKASPSKDQPDVAR